jgi:hypothetical protein
VGAAATCLERRREDGTRGGVAFTRPQSGAGPHSRDAASAPHRLDRGLHLREAALPPSGSCRLPLKGGVITVASNKASDTPLQVVSLLNLPQTSFKHSRITPPLRGGRTRRARGESLCAVTGSYSPSYRRRLIWWGQTLPRFNRCSIP